MFLLYKQIKKVFIYFKQYSTDINNSKSIVYVLQSIKTIIKIVVNMHNKSIIFYAICTLLVVGYKKNGFLLYNAILQSNQHTSFTIDINITLDNITLVHR